MSELRIVPYGTEVFVAHKRFLAREVDDIEVEKLYVMSRPGEDVQIGVSLKTVKVSHCTIELPPQYHLTPQEAVEAYVNICLVGAKASIKKKQEEIQECQSRLPKLAAIDWTGVPVRGERPDYDDCGF